MSGRVTRWFLVATFAVAVGHLAWRTVHGPDSPSSAEYRIGGRMTVLTGTDLSARRLYLRHKFHLAERPRHAWIELLGRDRVDLYVNGSLVQRRDVVRATAAMLVDLAPYLRIGSNVIAVNASQAGSDPPLVAVRAAYVLAGEEHSITADDQWRCAHSFDRQALYWFEPDFDDRAWSQAQRGVEYVSGFVDTAPSMIKTPAFGRWITSPHPAGRTASFRRTFELDSAPDHAWARLTTDTAYRLAVNGAVVDRQENQLGASKPGIARLRRYDLGPLLRRGTNTLALLTRSMAGPPRILLDIEIVGRDGHRVAFGTDEQWLSHAGCPPDWYETSLAGKTGWQASEVQAGDAGVAPWQPARRDVELTVPLQVSARRWAWRLGLMLAIGIVTASACAACGRVLDRRSQGIGGNLAGRNLACTCLLPTTLGISMATLATFDPRITDQSVYRLGWLALAVLAVPLQWAGLMIATRRSAVRDGSASHPKSGRWKRPLIATVLAALVLSGFGLRLRGVDAEPLHADELSGYRITMGFLDRGFPSIEVHPDLPPMAASTSELVYVATAIAAQFFDDPRFVVRMPAVCWGTLTIMLIFIAGRRLFGDWVALVAAVLYTFSPTTIEMTNFGRYFSQLQFLALLTVYLFYRLVSDPGPIRRGLLWLTTLSFIAMFLSWEASAMLAPGLVLLALVQRRGRLKELICNRSVWLAVALFVGVFLAQGAHRNLQQAQRQWYGSGTDEVALTLMSRYPVFDPTYYIWESSWSRDALIPMLGLLAAGLLSVRSRHRRPLRALLIVYLSVCAIQTLILPVRSSRYTHHFTPLTILMASVAFVACAQWLTHLVRSQRLPLAWRRYSGGLAALTVLVVVVASSGAVIHTTELRRYQVKGADLSRMKFPDQVAPIEYIRQHVQEGDVVIATIPQMVNQFLGRPADYWMQTRLHLQAVLDDKRTLPLHRLCGVEMLPDMAAVEDVFARNGRIWYIAVPGFHGLLNEPEASAYLRQNMDVVYEDFLSLVLFRGPTNRSAQQRLEAEGVLKRASAEYLP